MDAEKVEVGVAKREGQIIATDVSFEDYMAHYAANFCEWVDGVVIKMSPVSKNHAQLTFYLQMLLNTYFGLRTIGDVIAAPFVMKLDDNKTGREPDLQVI
jgi:Uma2 family endonuclease